jgi:hypothetical protein
VGSVSGRKAGTYIEGSRVCIRGVYIARIRFREY